MECAAWEQEDDSEKFLRKNVFSKLDMMVLYVDLVGSTTMTLEMPEEKIAINRGQEEIDPSNRTRFQ